MTLTAARQVADAVLYEGYLLYPYRASSQKNQVRWQFGILGPEGAASDGCGEEPALSAEVLLEQWPGARPAVAELELHLRFLQVQARVVERWTGDGWAQVNQLTADGARWIPFSEAVSREVPLRGVPLVGEHIFEVGAPADEEVEELREQGRLVGRLVRTRGALAGTVTVSVRPGADPRLLVLNVAVANRTRWTASDVPGWSARGPAARDEAARCSFVGTHLLLTVQGGRFVSLLDGPAWASADAASCRQHRCWPVLIAADDGSDAVLIAPIILGEHPAIAPESAGDLFDATEIDEILTLRVMTMTDQERADARGTDPRAAAILARCDVMSDEALGRMHGAERANRRPGLDLDEVPWFSEQADAAVRPEATSVLVDGVSLTKGSRVRLRPRRHADAHDMFLAGRAAVIARVDLDVDGRTHVAVLLEDDPALLEEYGRFYYFGAEEIEPLPAREDAR